jgi:hypothetical protein
MAIVPNVNHRAVLVFFRLWKSPVAFALQLIDI